jgi:hypothetical protein
MRWGRRRFAVLARDCIDATECSANPKGKWIPAALENMDEYNSQS